MLSDDERSRAQEQNRGTAFARSADVYDVIYNNKEYCKESATVIALVDPDQLARTWLEVAAGTGRHLECLVGLYELTAIDVSPEMLEIAAKRAPGVHFWCADMVSFDLGKRYDVVSCLFGSIAYAENRVRLESTIASISAHLQPTGRLIIEPWIFAADYEAGRPHARFVDSYDMKVARMNTNRLEHGCAILEFHHLVANMDGVEYFVETHRLGLFELDDYRRAFTHAGLSLEVVRTPTTTYLLGRPLCEES